MTDKDRQAIDDEADYFAMCILMPRCLLEDDIAAMGGIDLTDAEQVGKLAEKYGVDNDLMTQRIRQIREIGRP